MAEAGERDVRFQITGGFTLDTSKIDEEIRNVNDEIIGFRLKSGEVVRLIIAFEVEVPTSPDGSNDEYRDVTSEDEMEQLGFDLLEYTEAYFEDLEEEM